MKANSNSYVRQNFCFKESSTSGAVHYCLVRKEQGVKKACNIVFIKLVKGQFRSRILLLYQPSATLTALHFEKDININISLFDLEFTEKLRG